MELQNLSIRSEPGNIFQSIIKTGERGAKMIETLTEKGGEYGELGYCKYSTRNRKDKS